MDREQRTRRIEKTATRLRKHVIEMTAAAGSGHPGGSLSAAEIVSALYFDIMRIDPADPAWPDRDRFVLSKGHAVPIVYAALAERGFFPVSDLVSLRQIGSHLQGHPDMKVTPGIEMSTGSLGQGLSVSVGMALAGRLDSRPYRVFTLLGDGELQEGQVWEAAMAAAHYRLSNLIAIVDNNGLQIDGAVDEVMSPLPIADKFRAFGWHVSEIDGHDAGQVLDVLSVHPPVDDRPSVIVARTIKGRGVSFMEGRAEWHGTAPSAEQAKQALAELEKGGGRDG